MKTSPRLYETIIREHLSLYCQMVFLSGPRQVGKTTLARIFATDYLNWETKDVRQLVLKGAAAVVSFVVSSLASMLLRRIPRLGAWLCG